MRLDHIAYRVKDKWRTAQFFMDCFGYRLPEDLEEGFEIVFEDNTKAKCLVLLPPEKAIENAPWSHLVPNVIHSLEYHMAPEIFVSEGTDGSVVADWVAKRDGVGGIHHLAYQVENVAETMNEWKEKGFAEFTTPEPLSCPGLVQVFTKPSELTGIIYEFIERETQGFCQENVKDLMDSTKYL